MEIPPPPPEPEVAEPEEGAETGASEETPEREEAQELPGAEQVEQPKIEEGAEEAGEDPSEEEAEEQAVEGEAEAEEGTKETEAPSLVVAPQPQTPPKFPRGAKIIAELESLKPGESLSFRDTWDPKWEDKRVEYAVRHVNRKGRKSALSSVAPIDPLPPFAPPSGLEAEVGDGWVRLDWTPESQEAVPEATEGKFTYDFNVFRKAKAADSFPPAPLNKTPLPESRFLDRDVVFGKPWCYVVRTVAVAILEEPEPEEPEASKEESAEPETEEPEEPKGEMPQEPKSDEPEGARTAESKAEEEPSEVKTTGTPPPGAGAAPPQTAAPPVPPPPPPPKARRESLDSEEVCLTPEDTFPPATPGQLFAVESADGILLTWSDVDATDLKGYLVYRALRPRGTFELLTPEPLRLGSFLDRNVEPGVVYHYAVSAVDLVEPPNESPRSQPASARAPER
jgi:hypothetical protein